MVSHLVWCDAKPKGKQSRFAIAVIDWLLRYRVGPSDRQFSYERIITEEYIGDSGSFGSRQRNEPCYHLACDTFENNSNTALDQMSDAVAHSVLPYSKRNFEKNPLMDPAPFPTTGSGGGGRHHNHEHEVELS